MNHTILRKIIVITFCFWGFHTFAQEINVDDRVNITQLNKPYIGVYAFGYQGSPNPGYPQFQMSNYGGLQGAETATSDQSILGNISFVGHNGSVRRTVGVLRVRTMDDFSSELNARMDFLVGPNREMRMTLIGETGNVGIGTQIPSNALDIYRLGTNAGIEVTTDNGNAGNAQLKLKTNGIEDADAHFRKWGLNASGNVTGSMIPVSNLTVLRNGYSAGAMMIGNRSGQPLYWITNDEVGMMMDAEQRIGVGTIQPQSRLHISGISNNNTAFDPKLDLIIEDYNAFMELKGSVAAGVSFYAEQSSTYGGMFYDYSSNNLTFKNGNQDNLMTMDENGWVGIDRRLAINSDVSESRLTVEDDSDNYTATIINNGPSTSNFVAGGGLLVRAPYLGVDVDVNAGGEDGLMFGIYTNNFTGDNNLNGSAYGLYGYSSGARTSRYGNYSIYGFEGSTAGAGTNWAGYFSGSVRVTGTLDNTSDARLKRDVEDLEDAMGTIRLLHPKTYSFKTDEYPHMMLDIRPQMGFIAQEMEQVLPDLVRSAIHPESIPKAGSDQPQGPALQVKSINYIGIIPLLTQGLKEMDSELQEYQQQMDELKAENEYLKSELEALKSMVLKMNGNESNTLSITLDDGNDMAALEQNQPNPFSEQTIIHCYIPQSSQKAELVLTHAGGRILRTIPLTERGNQQIRLEAKTLSPGIYFYTLIVDGERIATRQLMLVD